MLYKTDKPIELKNPCEDGKCSKSQVACCKKTVRCRAHSDYNAQKSLLSLLAPVEARQLTDEKICKAVCNECMYSSAKGKSTCDILKISKLAITAQYAADLADRQKERERIVAEIELRHSFTNKSHTPPQMHFIFNESEWQSLKSKILEGKL